VEKQVNDTDGLSGGRTDGRTTFVVIEPPDPVAKRCRANIGVEFWHWMPFPLEEMPVRPRIASIL
jgi:hypothetical protein